MANQREELVRLRNHVRLTWRASVASFYNVQDILGPKRDYLLRIDPAFHSLDAAAYAYLATSRSFIRTADKSAGAIDVKELQEYRKNLDKEFPGHKIARDIIEHFEDYAHPMSQLRRTVIPASGQAFRAADWTRAYNPKALRRRLIRA